MHLGCNAVIPHDYFSDLPYGAAVAALRRRQQEERERTIVPVETSWNRQNLLISASGVIDSLQFELQTSVSSCEAQLQISRTYAWPTKLDAAQLRCLSSMTESSWKDFVGSLPVQVRADMIIRQQDDHGMLARVFFDVKPLKRATRRSVKYRVLLNHLQINVNGRVYMKQSVHSSGMRRAKPSIRSVGNCSWTQSRSQKVKGLSIPFFGVNLAL